MQTDTNGLKVGVYYWRPLMLFGKVWHYNPSQMEYGTEKNEQWPYSSGTITDKYRAIKG